MSDTFLRFPPNAIAAVTGAASGIGYATAAALLAQGLTVAAIDLDGDGLARAAEQLGERLLPFQASTTDAPQIAASFSELRKGHGPVNYLVNNAGPTSSQELTVSEGLAQQCGSMALVSEAWVASGPPEGAAVVHVASLSGTVQGAPPASLGIASSGAGRNGWYPAAKAAITGLTRWQAAASPGGIRANAVAPGVIVTPRMQAAGIADGAYGRLIRERNPLGRLGRPEDVANVIVFLLSPAAQYINGEVVSIDGGYRLVM